MAGSAAAQITAPPMPGSSNSDEEQSSETSDQQSEQESEEASAPPMPNDNNETRGSYSSEEPTETGPGSSQVDQESEVEGETDNQGGGIFAAIRDMFSLIF